MRILPRLPNACALVLAVLCGAAATVSAWPQPGGNDTFEQSASAGSHDAPRSNLEKWFVEGQAALRDGKLDAAEAAFRRVLAADAGWGAGYLDLCGVAMRGRRWGRAGQLLRKGEKLDPPPGGLRVDIGVGG